MTTDLRRATIYEGEGDTLMIDQNFQQRLVLIPDDTPRKGPGKVEHIRIMWGQNLLEDLLAGRYRSLVCAVNAEDNSHGIISQLAHLLPTSQWDAKSITEYCKLFAHRESLSVLKFDMDAVEVLGLMRPTTHENMTMGDLRYGFKFVTEMIARKPSRLPVASVSFLGANANRLVDIDDTRREPSFETVLRVMHESGFTGDVYPAPWMWESAPTAVFAHYPFPESLERMRQGGF